MSSRGGKKKSTKTSRSAKAGVIFPVGRMLRYIKKGHPKYRIGVGAPVYMAAVLEYLTVLQVRYLTDGCEVSGLTPDLEKQMSPPLHPQGDLMVTIQPE
ncbi:hypothetical protein U0070_009864 [Myodes glareolus]|uniref:Histone H2A n=1 Tax=Myodes glareolus TaxID=447135 RepID=A0AAW0HX64_MYOGA